MLAPPAGALGQGDEVYPFTEKQGHLAAVRVNPLEATPKNLARGKFLFDNVCITCHGPEAAGDGHLTKLFPKPPSLMTQKVRDWSDGRIVHVPMAGQGSMPKHVSVVENDDMWAVVLYIRSLQARLPVAPPPETAQLAPQPTPAVEGGQP
jgi:mono/diheme cytochrome c family protein